MRLLAAGKQSPLIVASGRRPGEGGVVAVVAHSGMCALRASGVEKRHQHTLLHQLVYLGHSLVEGRWVWRDVGFRQA